MVSRMREGERMERALEMGKGTDEGNEDLSINWKEALYLATRGGAITLGLPGGAGTFQVGAPFDAQLSKCIISQQRLSSQCEILLIVNLYDEESFSGIGPLDWFKYPDETQPITEEMLEKWWCIGDTTTRSALWVQGGQCYPAPPQ